MYKIMDGKKVSEKILEEVKEEVSKLEKQIKLVVISVGEDQASKVYIRNKQKACEKTGILFEEIHIDNTNLSSCDLFKIIHKNIVKLNEDKSVNGILIQKPIAGLNKEYEDLLFLAINPLKDVDVFNLSNSVRVYEGSNNLLPCTPKGILTLLDDYNINVEGKNVTIIGRSNIVGKPIALALLNRNATVTICHSKTKNLYDAVHNADIIISAVGIPKMLKASMIKNDIEAIIDVGMNRDEDGKLCGDIDFYNIIDRFDFQEEEINDNNIHYITPVPGGVGPMTVASLMQNTLELSKKYFNLGD